MTGGKKDEKKATKCGRKRKAGLGSSYHYKQSFSKRGRKPSEVTMKRERIVSEV